jgi:glycine/D-amino acid oxidase-like deaminating enzyme
MKIAILGNGILGTMTARAWLHAAPTADIVIVGPQARPGSATRAAAAMLNSFTELEGDSLGTPVDRFKFGLSRTATAEWPAIFEDIARETELAYGFGTYLLNNAATDDLDDENFAAVLRFCAEFEEPCEEIDPKSIPNYRPDPRHRALRAVFLKREGWVNPKQFLDALTQSVARHGKVRFVDAEVSKLASSNGKITSVELDNGEVLSADAFILCNGANAGKVLRESLPDLPVQRMFYGVGMSVEIQSQENRHTHCVRTTNRGLACGVYSVPYGPDRILIGASNYICPEPLDNGHVGSAYTLLKSAMDQINTQFSRARLININVGWRPTTSDTYPLFGKTSLDNLWILGGTKRDGFHLSPVLSRDLVAAMQGKGIDAGYAFLAPERALIRNMSREHAIEKTVRHQINAAYQHDFEPARNRMVEQLQRSLRADLTSLHDKLGAVDWGIPPELVDMYRYGHIAP